jgi:hypothetical protein
MDTIPSKTTNNKQRFFYVPLNLNLAERLYGIGEHKLTKPIHLDKFYYIIDSIYIRNVIRDMEWNKHVGLHSRILIKILTSRWASTIKRLLVKTGVIEQNTNYNYRSGHSAQQFRFKAEFRGARFMQIPATDVKLCERIRKAHDKCSFAAVGEHPAKALITKSVLTLAFDADAAREFLARTEYKSKDARDRRNTLIHLMVNRRNESFSADSAGRFYHAFVYLARDLRQFASWNGQALYAVDVSNCQPALHATLYPSECEEKSEYVRLVSTNTFYPFINARLECPFRWPEEKQLLKDDVFHYIFYGSRYAVETDMHKVFKTAFPILNGLLLEKKRFNTKDLPVAMQKMEADIVLNQVAAEFELRHRNEDCCLISIHDSLVSTADYVDELKWLMDKHFSAALGFKMPVKVERLTKCDHIRRYRECRIDKRSIVLI